MRPKLETALVIGQRVLLLAEGAPGFGDRRAAAVP